MKRRLTAPLFFLLFLLSISLVSAERITADTGYGAPLNILKNGSFEEFGHNSYPVNWTITGGLGKSILMLGAPNGKRVLKLNNMSSLCTVSQSVFDSMRGDVVNVLEPAIRVKLPSGSLKLRFRVVVENGRGTFAYATSWKNVYAKAAFQKIGLGVVSLSSELKSAVFYLDIKKNAVVNVYFDDARLLLKDSYQTKLAFGTKNYQWFEGHWPETPRPKTNTEMNTDTLNTYLQWAEFYLKENGAGSGQYYVDQEAQLSGQQNLKNYVSTSEATGYGMIINALVSGYSGEPAKGPNGTQLQTGKTYFDGLYNTYKSCKSTLSNYMMSWLVPKSGTGASLSTSATDGDLDIAYALILADRQWGSTGTINYSAAAKSLVKEILSKLVVYSGSKVFLICGDSFSSSTFTRMSDWMGDHFRAFQSFFSSDAEISGKLTVDFFSNFFSLYQGLQKNYSVKGLIPDFAYYDAVNTKLYPVTGKVLETVNDGFYYDNACRFPWRLATTFMHYMVWEAAPPPPAMASENRAMNGAAGAPMDDALTVYRMFCQPPNNLLPFVKEKTWINDNGTWKYDLGWWDNGYKLDGTKITGVEGNSAAYISPLVCAAQVGFFWDDGSESGWKKMLAAGWQFMKEVKDYADDDQGYYEKSINVLCMLLVSGNWWPPDANAWWASPW